MAIFLEESRGRLPAPSSYNLWVDCPGSPALHASPRELGGKGRDPALPGPPGRPAFWSQGGKVRGEGPVGAPSSQEFTTDLMMMTTVLMTMMVMMMMMNDDFGGDGDDERRIS